MLAQVRQAIRARHFSRRTEQSYVGWVRRFVRYHGLRHPADLGERDVSRFLSSLAAEHGVAAATQNQAAAACLFLYRDVLKRPMAWLDGVVRAKAPHRLPVVLTPDEVRAVFSRLSGAPRLVARLLYGSGLRLLEGLELRSRISISAAARSGCVEARVHGTGSRCCRRP